MNTNLHKAFVWICVIMTLYMLLLNVVLKSDTKIAFDDIDTRIDASRIDAITDSAEVVTPIEYKVDITTCVQTRRQQRLRDYCNHAPNNLEAALRRLKIPRQNIRDALRYITVDDQLGVLFCSPPKTGSTYLKKLWSVFKSSEPMKSGEKRGVQSELRLLSSYTDLELTIRLRTYYKFVVTRHPAHRTVALYNDKLRGNRSTVTAVSDFASVIADVAGSDYEGIDWHFRSVWHACAPCAVHYDYVAAAETSGRDLRHVLTAVSKRNGRKGRLSREVREQLEAGLTSSRGTTESEVERYFAGVDIGRLRKLRFNAYYSADYAMFGYNPDNYTIVCIDKCC